MSPRFGSPRRALSRRTEAAVREAHDRLTIRRMLSLGGVVVVSGDKATITIPTGGFGTFPAALVSEVQAHAP